MRGIEIIRSDIPWEQLAKIECLYCMDGHQCRICKGKGYETHRGAFKLCWNCKGTGICPDCAEREGERLSA